MTSRLETAGTSLGLLTGASFCLLALVLVIPVYSQQARPASRKSSPSVPRDILLRIVEAEDKRLWNNNLSGLLADQNPSVRKRAALAAGRIGDEHAVPTLVSLLQNDKDADVRDMAAFALGEIESPVGAAALINELAKRDASKIRGRAIEALGKITAALPASDKARLASFQKEIYNALQFEASRRSESDTEVIILSLTAALRARPEGVGKVIAEFLSYSEPRIRADAANALARLRAKDGNDQLRKLLTTDPDPIVRANAARVLGATKDEAVLAVLINRALHDTDSRVRVSAIRAIVAVKDDPAAHSRFSYFLANAYCHRQLFKTGNMLFHQRDGECLEIITSLGRILQGSEDKDLLSRIRLWRLDFNVTEPEIEIAMVRISPGEYLERLGDAAKAKREVQNVMLRDWSEASSVAQGLGEIAALPDSRKDKKQLSEQAEGLLRAMLDYPRENVKENGEADSQSPSALPDVLRAFAAFKTSDLDAVLRKQLSESDVVVRATSAELLGDLPPSGINTSALAAALPFALAEKASNDAALAIVDALGKQKNQEANEALKSALASNDHLVRRRAVALLKTNGVGDFSERIGAVQTKNKAADYKRAVARIGKKVRATVKTDKGSFIIELLPELAPLNVDNFVQLSKRGYFKGIVFHRVVPNFVIQGGDPRGDGNGGPGYQIRCEINQVPYERGAVGMALSGKDTGGSQWFVTHSRQPHLDGGYTAFGRVISGMDVVDRIVRGDVIRSIVIKEGAGPDF